MPYEAKTNWKYDDTVTEKDLNRIEQGLKDAHVAEYKDITLKPGVQIVDVPEDTPFRMGEIRGRTLINLLGYAGACENTSLWKTNSVTAEKFTSEKVQGESSLKVTLGNVYEAGNAYRFIENTSSGKSYVVVGYIKNGSEFGKVRLEALEYNGDKSLEFHMTRNVDSSDMLQPVHMAFTLSDQATRFAVHLAVLGKMNESYGLFDAIRLYEIPTSEVEKINAMTSEQVSAAYPYVDAMTNVTNPYAITTSGNLLRPFTEPKATNIRDQSSVNIISSYEIELTASVENQYTGWAFTIQPNTTYTFSCEHDGMIAVGWDFDSYVHYTREQNVTFNSGDIDGLLAGRDTCYVWFSNWNLPLGKYKFKNPMLVPGDKQHLFAPQTQSIWATECQLAANSTNGCNADVLFVGDDGLPYVHEWWKKVIVDVNRKWQASKSLNGMRQILTPNFSSIGSVSVDGMQYMTKYDGSQMKIDGQVKIADTFHLQPTTGYLYIGVSNEDSGWGEDYDPTEDEIKAYLLGWKMGNNADYSFPSWNGVGTKAWYKLFTGVGPRHSGAGGAPIVEGSYSATVPTTLNNQGYRPYKLQYLKTKPVIEPVLKYETGLLFRQGWNQVEVNSGVILREKTDSFLDVYNQWNLGNPVANINARPFKYGKAEDIKYIYNSGNKDSRWRIEHTKEYGTIAQLHPPYILDPKAIYHVTYTIQNSTLSQDIIGRIGTNLRSTIDDIVKVVSNSELRLSIVENKKAEKDIASVPWIKPTLLNKWVDRNIGDDAPTGYMKDQLGFVHVRGIVTGGATSSNVFFLPEGYRPSRRMQFINISHDQQLLLSYITVEKSGAVYINSGAGDMWLTLDNIYFYAEQ